MALQIVPIDYRSPNHRWAVVSLLEHYAETPQAGGAGLSDAAREHVVALLEGFPTAVVLLAVLKDEPVGLAVCVESLSTFSAAPVLNIHDLVVSPNHRNQGVGKRLLEEVELEARRRGCAWLTLEVVGGNKPAQRLYRRFGFTGGESIQPTHTAMFWKKPLH